MGILYIKKYQSGGKEVIPDFTVPEGAVVATPLNPFYAEYESKNPYKDFFHNKKQEYLRKGNKGLHKIFNISEDSFPDAEIDRIYDEYQYNRNNYAIEQYAKRNNIDLTDRESILNKAGNAKVLSKAMANSKYGNMLQPSLWARTKGGAVSAVNFLGKASGRPGPVWTPDIKGLTPQEEAEYYNPKNTLAELGNVADVFSVADAPGAYLMNRFSDARKYANNPSFLSTQLNARTTPLAASLPGLVMAPASLFGAPDVFSLAGKGLKQVGNYTDKSTDIIKYYHGSPWNWDSYDIHSIGKSEGAAKRGAGLNLFPEEKYYNAPKFANIKSSDAPIHLGKSKPLTEAEKASISPTIYEFHSPKDLKLKDLKPIDFKKGYDQNQLIAEGYDGIKTEGQVTIFPNSINKLKINKKFTIDEFVNSKPNTEWNPWSVNQQTYINTEGRTVFKANKSFNFKPKEDLQLLNTYEAPIKNLGDLHDKYKSDLYSLYGTSAETDVNSSFNYLNKFLKYPVDKFKNNLIYPIKYRPEIKEAKKVFKEDKAHLLKAYEEGKLKSTNLTQDESIANKKLNIDFKSGSNLDGRVLTFDPKQFRSLKKEGWLNKNTTPGQIIKHEFGHDLDEVYNFSQDDMLKLPLSKDLLNDIRLKNSDSKLIQNSLYSSIEEERIPHLREMKQSLVNSGVITNMNSPVTEKDLLTYWGSNANDIDRISSFVDKNNPVTYKLLSNMLSKVRVLAPVGLASSLLYNPWNKKEN